MANELLQTPSSADIREKEVAADLAQQQEQGHNSIDELQEQLATSRSQLAVAISQLKDKQDLLAEQNSEFAELKQQLSSLELTIAFQRKRIRALDNDNERIGADLEILKSLERRLLLSWQHLGMSRLAPSVPVANEQLDALWNYVREMSSPGHRMISFLGHALGMTWIGRKIRSAMHFCYLLGKTK